MEIELKSNKSISRPSLRDFLLQFQATEDEIEKDVGELYDSVFPKKKEYKPSRS